MSARKWKSITGSIACTIFALLSLGMGFHMSIQVQRMESVGVHADAIITRIETGVKNSKTAIVAFSTDDDAAIEAACIFQMFLVRYDAGDEVDVLYDRDEPESVMIDNGGATGPRKRVRVGLGDG